MCVEHRCTLCCVLYSEKAILMALKHAAPDTAADRHKKELVSKCKPVTLQKQDSDCRNS